MSSSSSKPLTGYLADQDRGPSFVIYTIIMASATVVAVFIRFCSRALTPRKSDYGSKFWWDDWAALATLPFSITTQTLAAVMVHYGLGKHVWNVPTEDIEKLSKLLVADETLFIPGAAMAKASALFFYQRVFDLRFTPKWFVYGIYVTHMVNVCWWIAADVSLVLMCDPPSKQWKPEEPGRCGKIGTHWLGNIIPGICIDISILMLPLPLIWRLQLSRTRKIGLTVVFLFGYSVIGITIGRLMALLRLDVGLDSDFTYDAATAFYWFGAEVPVTLVSACLPVMSPLLRHVYLLLSKFAQKIADTSNGGRSQRNFQLTEAGDSEEDEESAKVGRLSAFRLHIANFGLVVRDSVGKRNRRCPN